MGEELSTLSIPSPWGAPPPPRMAVRIFRPMVRRLAHGEGEIPCTLQNDSLNAFEAVRYSGRFRIYLRRWWGEGCTRRSGVLIPEMVGGQLNSHNLQNRPQVVTIRSEFEDSWKILNHVLVNVFMHHKGTKICYNITNPLLWPSTINLIPAPAPCNVIWR